MIIARNPLPQRGILPLPNSPMDAISPRRRRIPTGAARERFSHVLDGTKLVSNRTCTNYIHHQSPYKSFARLFQKPRSPRSLVPYKVTPPTQQPSEQWCLPAFPDRRRALRDRGTCRNPSAALSVRGRPSAVPLRPRVHRRSGS